MLLFTDTLVSNFAFNPSAEMALESMKVFNNYDPYLMVLIASTAFFISCIINYVLGILCYKILSPGDSEELEGLNKRLEGIRSCKYLFFLLPLSAVPFFGKFIILFAGFCRTRFLFTILIATTAKIIYYAIFMLL